MVTERTEDAYSSYFNFVVEDKNGGQRKGYPNLHQASQADFDQLLFKLIALQPIKDNSRSDHDFSLPIIWKIDVGPYWSPCFQRETMPICSLISPMPVRKYAIHLKLTTQNTASMKTMLSFRMGIRSRIFRRLSSEFQFVAAVII